MAGPEAIPFNYADDTGLLYVITESNRDTLIKTPNQELQALMDWGAGQSNHLQAKEDTLDGDLEEGIESL